MTVFSLGWGTSALGYTRARFLIWQMIGVLFFALMIPVSAAIADRSGRKAMLGAAKNLSAYMERHFARPSFQASKPPPPPPKN